MRPLSQLTRVVALALLFGCPGCETNEPSREDSEDTQIEETEQRTNQLLLRSDGEVLSLVLLRGTESEGPRMAEIYLHLDGNAAFDTATAGAALTDAGKALVSQVKEDGRLRLVMYASDNTKRMESGVLAQIKVRRDGPGKIVARIDTDTPLFAPHKANDGLSVGDPIPL